MINKGLLSWLSKKKLTDEKVANIFVNSSFETVEKGWPEVASMLNASENDNICCYSRACSP